MALRVAGEVEVELRNRLLDDPPRGLAEIGHESHQHQPGGVRRRALAEVPAEQLVVLLGTELVIDREVP
jgi:hypothetical protein